MEHSEFLREILRIPKVSYELMLWMRDDVFIESDLRILLQFCNGLALPSLWDMSRAPT